MARRDGVPYKGKSTTTRESKRNRAGTSQLGKDIGILWNGECTRGCMVVRVRMNDRRGHRDLHRI